MMKFSTLALALVCLNVSVFFLIGIGVITNTPQGYNDPTANELTDVFKWENINFLDPATLGLAIGGAIGVGVLTAFLHNVSLGAFAIFIWVAGVMLKPIGWIVAGFPAISGSLMQMMGIDPIVTTIIQQGLGIFYAASFFLLFIQLFAQRESV